MSKNLSFSFRFLLLRFEITSFLGSLNTQCWHLGLIVLQLAIYDIIWMMAKTSLRSREINEVKWLFVENYSIKIFNIQSGLPSKFRHPNTSPVTAVTSQHGRGGKGSSFRIFPSATDPNGRAAGPRFCKYFRCGLWRGMKRLLCPKHFRRHIT